MDDHTPNQPSNDDQTGPVAGLGDDAPLMPGQYKNARHHDPDDDKQEREYSRAVWKQEEEERKREARKQAEQERLEAERRLLYAKLEKLDYDLLGLTDYPTDYEVNVARRTRLAWFAGLGCAVFLFISSLLKVVGPWVGGIAGGLAFVLWLTHGVGLLNVLPGLTLYNELILQRRRCKKELLAYIRELEGSQGYLHRIYPLVEYNERLEARKFKRLALQSKEGKLLANMKTLNDTSLYHQFLLEALSGYHELLQREKEDELMESMADLENELTDIEEDDASQEKSLNQDEEKSS